MHWWMHLRYPKVTGFKRIYELDKADFECPPDRTDQVTIIQITIFPGRSLDAKRKLYSNIVQNLGDKPGINGLDIMIILMEPPMDNWGVRGGKTASEVDFDFDIDV